MSVFVKRGGDSGNMPEMATITLNSDREPDREAYSPANVIIYYDYATKSLIRLKVNADNSGVTIQVPIDSIFIIMHNVTYTGSAYKWGITIPEITPADSFESIKFEYSNSDDYDEAFMWVVRVLKDNMVIDMNAYGFSNNEFSYYLSI